MRDAFRSVRRSGTVSIIGVYGGQTDPLPMMDLFDKGVTLRMGQAQSSAGSATSWRWWSMRAILSASST